MLAAVLKGHSIAAGWLLLGAGLGLLSGCGGGSSSGSEVASDRSAILNGTLSGREDDAVVQVIATTPGIQFACTGTLIAHNLVITARHCVSDFEDLTFTCLSNGELSPSSKGGRMKALYAPSQISVRVGDGPKPVFGAGALELFAADTPSVCRNDIALILLDRELSDLPIMPVRLLKGTERGEELRVVGYGVDETRRSGSRHTRSGLIVSEVGPSQFTDPGDSVPPRTFVTEGGALCIGDSGGPAFVDETVTAGVWSQVVGDCTTASARNYFTEIAPFADGLVLPAFKAAGAEPWYEGTTGPGIDPGTTGGTGGAGTAGDTSTAGDAMTEGGTPGTGGSSTSGGSLSTGGLVGSGGDERGGAPAQGGSTGLGGSATSGASGADGGLRKKGGCTCGVVGAPSGGSELLLVPLAALALLRRRREQLGC